MQRRSTDPGLPTSASGPYRTLAQWKKTSASECKADVALALDLKRAIPGNRPGPHATVETVRIQPAQPICLVANSSLQFGASDREPRATEKAPEIGPFLR